MKKDTGVVIAAVAGATALVVGMGVADSTAPSATTVARSARQMPRSVVQEKVRESGEAERERAAEAAGEGFEPGEGEAREAENENLDGPAQQQYDQRSYPRGYISLTRTNAARRAYANLPTSTPLKDFKRGTSKRVHKASVSQNWQELGPQNPLVPSEVTYTGAETTNSGRITALAIAPTCAPTDCRLWVAAAGGGVWRTEDATATQPDWTPLDNGLTTNTFGSLALDPNDPSGNTVYAGSGEPSGSSDSEAGVGLFKSTNAGDTWTLVPGSAAVAAQRSIAAILIDPNDANNIWIGTALARHGSSSVNGGRRTPPNAPTLGIYKSTNGGTSFALDFSEPADPTPPDTGLDFFTGGVRRLVFDPNDTNQIYASIQGYGLYRHGNSNDANPASWNQIYASEWGDDSPTGETPDPYGAFTDFDLADTGADTRIYVGDTSDDYGIATFYAAEKVQTYSNSALVAAENPLVAPWDLKSDEDMADPQGYSSYNWCQNGQCSYDAFVKVDPNDPDTVWLGGSMAYNELYVFGEAPVSNGRAVVRSTDGGTSFTDMTNDLQSPPQGMHPDQRALVFNPANTAQTFIGSDGGLVRTNGTYADGDDCATREDVFGTPLTAEQEAFCSSVTALVPQRIDSLNVGLNTLQFQSLSVNSTDPLNDVIGGTQDNGTWAWDGTTNLDSWFESVGGDGGQSGISPGANSRMHTYYGTAGDVNFDGNNPQAWNYVTGPMDYSGENSSFYVPMIADPALSGTYFMGAESVWRTNDSGGDQTQLETQCNEFTGTGPFDDTCGDWINIGAKLAPAPSDYIVALGRTTADTSTLWAGLRYGDLFVTTNADAGRTQVSFDEIDTADTPGRFVSGIEVDPKDPNHAWISYSGYGAYTPDQPGHVFEAVYDPQTATASFTDRSNDLGDQPVTGLGVDWLSGDVYASTDFGVARLASGATSWSAAAGDLPPVATYGLTTDASARVVYAATHGRGAYRLPLDPVAAIEGPTGAVVGEQLTFGSSGSGAYGGTTLLWTLPDGTTSSAATVDYTPTSAGEQQISLKVTDSLGQSATASLTLTVTQALNAQFGPVTSKVGGFTVPVTNYNGEYTWTVTASAGEVSISDTGLITVTGLSSGKSATVTVGTTREGYPDGEATVTGTAKKQCTLTVKAKKSSYKLPKQGTAKVVKKATTSTGSCKVTVKIKKTSLSGGKAKISTAKAKNGSLKITTYGDPVKVTATYTAKSSKKDVAKNSWSRSWKTKK